MGYGRESGPSLLHEGQQFKAHYRGMELGKYVMLLLGMFLVIGHVMGDGAYIKDGYQSDQLGAQITNLIQLSDGNLGFAFCAERSGKHVTFLFTKISNNYKTAYKYELTAKTSCGILKIVEDRRLGRVLGVAMDGTEPFLWVASAEGQRISYVLPTNYSSITPYTLIINSKGELVFGGTCISKDGTSTTATKETACVGKIGSTNGVFYAVTHVENQPNVLTDIIEPVAGKGYFAATIGKQLVPFVLNLTMEFEIVQSATRSEIKCLSPQLRLTFVDNDRLLLTCTTTTTSLLKLSASSLASLGFADLSTQRIYATVFVASSGRVFLFGELTTASRIVVSELLLDSMTVVDLNVDPPTWGHLSGALNDGSVLYSIGSNNDNRLYLLTLGVEKALTCAQGQVNYRNQACKSLLTSDCHAACGSNCVGAKSRFQCHTQCATFDSSMESMPFLNMCQCKLEYGWSEAHQRCRQVYYTDCHYLCGSHCLEKHNATQCFLGCLSSYSEPNIDASQSANNVCACRSSFNYSDTDRKCVNISASNGTNADSRNSGTSAGLRIGNYFWLLGILVLVFLLC